MKEGDIVYVNKLYIARYCCGGGDSGFYEYHFRPGDMYRVDIMYGGGTGGITNLSDGKSHFMHSSIRDILISQEEYRNLTLEKLGI